jgi:hypothetical protein
MAVPVLTKASPYRIIDFDHDRVGRWLHDQGGSVYRDGTKCIGLTRHGELVAATSYDSFNGCSIVAGIAITGPITRQWLYYIFAYPFIQLKVNVILGLVSSANRKSIHLCERMGFQSVADIPHADPSGLLCLYTLHKDDCRFLKGYFNG